jgi:hypothetical protein
VKGAAVAVAKKRAAVRAKKPDKPSFVPPPRFRFGAPPAGPALKSDHTLDLGEAADLIEAGARLREQVRGEDWANMTPWHDVSMKGKVAWIMLAFRGYKAENVAPLASSLE